MDGAPPLGTRLDAIHAWHPNVPPAQGVAPPDPGLELRGPGVFGHNPPVAIAFDVNDASGRDAFLRRHLWDALAGLREDTPPRWGRMSAQQMVEHLAWIFEISTGRASAACATPEAKRERFKAFLHNNTPMPREFRNPVLIAGLPPLGHAGLAAAHLDDRPEAERTDRLLAAHAPEFASLRGRADFQELMRPRS